MKCAVVSRWACRKRRLLSFGADADAQDKAGRRALELAKVDATFEALKAGKATMSDMTHEQKNTLLLEYAGKGLTCRVLMALQAGAKITAKNKGGMTALALACVKVGNTEKFLGRSIRRRGAAWPRGGPLGEGDGDIYHHKHCLCRASEVTTLKFLKLCLSSRKMLRTINILPPVCCTVSLNQKHPPGGAGGISEESRNRGLDSVSDM